MKSHLRILAASLALTSLAGVGVASAQGPDIRNIRPHVVLLVDTSGSMERKPDCICSTPACLECLPVCSPGTYEENRWALVAQALTGEFTPFECNSDLRIGGIYSGEYDEGYFLPHIQLPQEIGTWTGSQSGNGVLDTYLERIKFGLMTFDSIGTLSTEPPLVTQTTFETAPFLADSIASPGMYSFADNRPFSFPGALATYMINSGARDSSATEGGLVSVGADSTASMTSTNASIQATILGDTGLGKNPLRPFGATPTAALVEDLQTFLQTDGDVTQKTSASGPGDPYYGCRPRSAVLITDGFPNGDMRGPPVNCDLLGQPVGSTGCPYREVQDTVDDMIASNELDKFYVIGFALDGDPGEVAAVEALLNDIASIGDTDEAFLVADRAELVSALSSILNEQNPGATSRTAPVQTGLTPGLVQAQFISGFNVSLDAADPWDGILERRRIECQAGSPVPQTVEDRDRFHVQLNNQSAAPGDVEPFSADSSATFAGGFSRNLWTVVPADPADVNGHLVGDGRTKLTDLNDDGIDVPTNTGLEIRDVPAGEFNKSLSPEYFFGTGSTNTAGRDAIVDWVHGVPGTDRENERLGDIYHSTPAIVGPLIDDIEDRSYNDWRLGFAHQQSPDSAEDLTAPAGWQLNERPRVIYASTNDGIIHAFLADDYPANSFNAGNNLQEFSCANDKNAGTELWGFIPPMFLDDLDDLISAAGSKHWYADGSIVIRNLYDVRSFSEADGGGGVADSPAGQTNVWRTVMFLSFRNGGQGMVAIDVTNPCKPEFLWQFTDPNLGDTYGQPTAAQVFLEDSNPTPAGNFGGPVVFQPRQSRGVILLPGGQGVEDGTTCTYTTAGPELPQGMDTATGSAITPRSDRRCWRGTTSSPPATRHGRSLYVIDLITGTLIREIGEDVFPAPLNGAVSVFRGDTATVGSVAYTVDADGVLWRIDLASPDPDDWGAEALHDLYYAEAFDSAEPTYYQPALTINNAGEIVILVGTGNIDVLDDATAVNKVVSITEKLTFDNEGFISAIEGRLNWEIELEPGEQMTGPLELFGGQVFFGTFEAGTGTPTDACPFGASRIFGVGYLDDPTSPGDLIPLLADALGSPTTVLDSTDIPQLSNALLVGLQVAQQPVCTLTDDIDIVDPFTGQAATLAMPYATSGRDFKLMAHLSGSTALSGGLAIALLEEEGISAPEGFTVISGMAETME